MAITNLDDIANALGNNASRIILDKASLANQVAGRFTSLWRATGQPAQGAIPTTAAVCTTATLGGFPFAQQVGPATSYVAYLKAACSNSAASLELHDRLAHNGGLVLNVATLQTTNLPLNLATLGVDTARVGSGNYDDVQWWLEVYADGGATASSATINVTFDDDSTGNLNVLAVGGTIRIGHMFGLDILRTTAQQGKNIKGVNSIILSASTGTAGNFGFTVTRPRTDLFLPLANTTAVGNWATLGFSEVPNGACLTPMLLPTTTSSGTLRGGGKIIHG